METLSLILKKFSEITQKDNEQEINKDAYGSKSTSGCKDVTVVGDETVKVNAKLDKAEKAKRMNQLRMKLKTVKGKATKILNKIEPAVVLCEKMKKKEEQSRDQMLKPKKYRVYSPNGRRKMMNWMMRHQI